MVTRAEGALGGKQIYLDPAQIDQNCNALGMEGWELASCQTNIFDSQTVSATLIFKRPVWN